VAAHHRVPAVGGDLEVVDRSVDGPRRRRCAGVALEVPAAVGRRDEAAAQRTGGGVERRDLGPGRRSDGLEVAGDVPRAVRQRHGLDRPVRRRGPEGGVELAGGEVDGGHAGGGEAGDLAEAAPDVERALVGGHGHGQHGVVGVDVPVEEVAGGHVEGRQVGAGGDGGGGGVLPGRLVGDYAGEL